MSRGQTRSPHDNFRSFLQKTALTLARGIEGFRGQIQTDCKWEIQVRNKSEESKWTEWFSEFFVKDGEGENQIFRSFYKKRNTSTEKHMSKHCHLSLYLTNMGAILTSSSVIIHQLSPAMIPGTRGKKFRVPLSPWQAHQCHHQHHPHHPHHHWYNHHHQALEAKSSEYPSHPDKPTIALIGLGLFTFVLTASTDCFLVNDDIGGSWPRNIKNNNSDSVIDSHFQVFNGLAGSGAGVPSGQ